MPNVMCGNKKRFRVLPEILEPDWSGVPDCESAHLVLDVVVLVFEGVWAHDCVLCHGMGPLDCVSSSGDICFEA